MNHKLRPSSNISTVMCFSHTVTDVFGNKMTADSHVTLLFPNHGDTTALCVWVFVCVWWWWSQLAHLQYRSYSPTGVPHSSGDHAVIKSVHCVHCTLWKNAAWHLSKTLLSCGNVNPTEGKLGCPSDVLNLTGQAVRCEKMIVLFNARYYIPVHFLHVYMHWGCVAVLHRT